MRHRRSSFVFGIIVDIHTFASRGISRGIITTVLRQLLEGAYKSFAIANATTASTPTTTASTPTTEVIIVVIVTPVAASTVILLLFLVIIKHHIINLNVNNRRLQQFMRFVDVFRAHLIVGETKQNKVLETHTKRIPKPTTQPTSSSKCSRASASERRISDSSCRTVIR